MIMKLESQSILLACQLIACDWRGAKESKTAASSSSSSIEEANKLFHVRVICLLLGACSLTSVEALLRFIRQLYAANGWSETFDFCALRFDLDPIHLSNRQFRTLFANDIGET